MTKHSSNGAGVATERQRRLAIAGTFNLRDLGGYPTIDGGATRWGVFFRADSLHALPEEGQDALLGHGIRTVVDLRHPTETEHWPNVFATSERVRYLNLPLNSAPRSDGATPRRVELDLEAMNRRYLDEAQPAIAAVMGALASGPWPAVVHCQAGKDRTGLIVALALSAVGVPDTTVAVDYALTADFLDDAFYAAAREQAKRYQIAWEDYEKLLGCPPEIMVNTLAYLDERYGGPLTYLREIGLNLAQLRMLHEALVG
jgi:protein-tyrosine phosphatase